MTRWTSRVAASRTRSARCQVARSRCVATGALILAASYAHGAGLVVVDWSAQACAIAVSGNEDHCSGIRDVDVSITGPGSPGPLAFQPSTAYVSVGTTASAYQTAGGWNAADAAASTAANGQNFAARSHGILAVDGLNEGPDPVQYTFHFLINGGALTMQMQEFVANGSRYPSASVQAYLIIGLDDSTTLASWSYRATLTGVNVDIPIIFAETVSDPLGLAIGKPGATVTHGLTPEGVRSAVATFGPFVGSVPLPAIPAGSTIHLEYGVFAGAYTGQHDPVPNPLYDEPFSSVSAWIADPFGLEGGSVPGEFPAEGFDLGGRSLAELTAVPAPPAALLLPTALLAAARFAARPRRRAS